ncbi:MAG: histidine kinase [Naasia sp.]|nr:histidine kinase [Naasia sp.]
MRFPAAGRTRLTVRDDGTGFDPATRAAGFWLTGMRDRLARRRRPSIASGPGGTTLTVELPHPVRA